MNNIEPPILKVFLKGQHSLEHRHSSNQKIHYSTPSDINFSGIPLSPYKHPNTNSLGYYFKSKSLKFENGTLTNLYYKRLRLVEKANLFLGLSGYFLSIFQYDLSHTFADSNIEKYVLNTILSTTVILGFSN